MPTGSFSDLVARVRTGNAEAASELVKLYEPEVRRYIRVRLTDPHLCRLLDSVDICQSVLAAFFVRAVKGQFDLNEPSDLVRLLTVMAKNKLTDHARRSAGHRSRLADSEVLAGAPAQGATPSQLASFQELLEQANGRMTPDERRLAELRAAGASWQEVAIEFGMTPEGARKRFKRTLDRVCVDLGIETVMDE